MRPPLGVATGDRIIFNRATQMWERAVGGELNFSAPTVQALKTLTTADGVGVGTLAVVTATGNLYRAATAGAAGSTWTPADGMVDVRDCGASPDGVTDNSLAVAAAIGVVAAGNADGVRYGGPGVFVQGQQAVPAGCIVEIPAGVSVLMLPSTTANVFVCSAVTNVVFRGGGTIDGNRANQTGNVSGAQQADGITVVGSADVRVEGLTVTGTKGWGVFVGTSSDVTLDRVNIANTKEKGINFGAGATRCKATGCDISTTGGGAFEAIGIELDDGCTDIEIIGCTVHDTASIGISIHGHDAIASPQRIVIANNTIDDSVGAGIRVAAHQTAADELRDVVIAANVVHSPTQEGILVTDNEGSGPVTNRDVEIACNIVVGAGTVGIRTTRVASCLLAANTIRNSVSHGIEVAPGSVSNVGIRSNTVRGSGGDGIRLSTASAIALTGNLCTGNTGFGVNEVGGNSNWILNNQLTGNTAGALQHTGGTATRIRNNSGFITENEGTATIPNGSTFIDVAHGLSETPLASAILVSPTNDLGAAAKFWVNNINATNIRVNVDVNPGAPTATFSWKAVILT